MPTIDVVTGLSGGAAFKLPARAATTAAITLEGEQTIDGIAIVSGDRVLVKNQGAGADNGIYIADTSSWQRAPDCDGAYDLVTGSLVAVNLGTVNAGLIYRLTTTGTIQIGTTSLTFELYTVSGLPSVPVPVNQGGTGATTAAEAAGAMGIVQVTSEGGTANAQTGTIPANVTAYATDQIFLFTPSAANTSAATLTLTPSGGSALAAKNVFANGAALVGGELQAGVPTVLYYDGTQLNMLGPIGPRPIPQNSQSADYPIVIGDANKHILHPSADNNPRTFTIPANASVPFPLGTVLMFANEANTLTVAITSDTLTLAGSGATGSRTLAAPGLLFAIKVGTTSWLCTGTGVS